MNTRICKVCKVAKPHIRAYKDHRGTYHYTNTQGKKWKCTVCPECYVVQQAAINKVNRPTGVRMKALRSRRTCKRCDKLLPPSKYFYHETCAPYSYFFNNNEEHIYL